MDKKNQLGWQRTDMLEESFLEISSDIAKKTQCNLGKMPKIIPRARLEVKEILRQMLEIWD